MILEFSDCRIAGLQDCKIIRQIVHLCIIKILARTNTKRQNENYRRTSQN